jgi:hypothetical protein
MADEPDEPLIFMHQQSPEVREAAPIARELVRARLMDEKALMSGILSHFLRRRENESKVEWQSRQAALASCLVRVAAEALLTLYQDGKEPLNQDLIDRFLENMAKAGITI